MLAVSFLLAAGSLSAPVLDEGLSRTMLRDYPSWALREGKSAASLIEIWTDPEGRVYECKTLGTAGDEKLAKQICDLFIRQKVEPATTADGQSAFGRYRTTIFLTLPNTKQGQEVAALRTQPDGAISVTRLPSGFKADTDIDLAVFVDESGRVSDCEVQGSAPRELGEIACQTFAAEQLPVGMDSSGNAVSYITNLKVRFSLEEPA